MRTRLTKLKSRRMDNLDASENAFFSRQLEMVKSRTYDRKYPNLRAREFVPLDPELDNAVETIRLRSYTQVGIAKLIASYADDLPRADVKTDDATFSVKSIGTSYGYNLQEVRAAQRAAVAIDQKKAAAARRATEVVIDRVLALGDSATGLTGLLNVPNALVYTVPADGAGSSALWTAKTPALIIRDMVGICEFIVNSTSEIEAPNTLIMPRAQFTLIRTTRFDSNSDKTILDWFKTQYPGVAVEPWYRMLGAGSGGTQRMMAYTMSPDHLQGAVPQEFEQLPVQEKGLEFIVPCHARVGGVQCYYPLSVCYGDGI
jgi:hypothetical protein